MPRKTPRTFNQRFGDRLRELREAAKLSQVELAAQLSYPDGSQVSRWEHGHAFPSDDNREALARAFGIDQEGLFAGDLDRRRR
jgi:transcriptional regulator with XRE-family HTH domain